MRKKQHDLERLVQDGLLDKRKGKYYMNQKTTIYLAGQDLLRKFGYTPEHDSYDATVHAKLMQWAHETYLTTPLMKNKKQK